MSQTFIAWTAVVDCAWEYHITESKCTTPVMQRYLIQLQIGWKSHGRSGYRLREKHHQLGRSYYRPQVKASVEYSMQLYQYLTQEKKFYRIWICSYWLMGTVQLNSSYLMIKLTNTISTQLEKVPNRMVLTGSLRLDSAMTWCLIKCSQMHMWEFGFPVAQESCDQSNRKWWWN